ncbi:MAG: hypothetical protein ACHQCE_11145, partial [Streptosporangiales bacterium]
MPRAGLTPERIIWQAATVADEVGLDRLTLAAVAQRCGDSLPGPVSYTQIRAHESRAIISDAVLGVVKGGG